jgi:hypothetical protein
MNQGLQNFIYETTKGQNRSLKGQWHETFDPRFFFFIKTPVLGP